GDICASMNDMKKNNNQKHQGAAKDATVGCTLWTDGLICAFEAKQFESDDNEVTVADIAVPYRERPVGPTWWCHVEAGHLMVHSWLSNSKWLHPAISIALRDESKLISERMKHLLYENFLVTALHVKGSATNVNVLGVSEVQELLAAGGSNLPQSIHEVIALLACRLARWDDRLFRKYIFGAADEVELKFMNRRNHEDLHLFSIILNQEIRRLSSQSTVRAWLQDKSLRVTHNLAVFGGVGLVLSIITGLFGINVDGIPGSENSPYAFLVFTCILVLLGIILIFMGLLYLGLKNPAMEEEVEVRKLELQELVKMFQQEAESHAQLRKTDSRTRTSSAQVSNMLHGGSDSYLLMPSDHH
ncbi:retrotransposon protein, partial [Tanacetum coccineum]